MAEIFVIFSLLNQLAYSTLKEAISAEVLGEAH